MTEEILQEITPTSNVITDSLGRVIKLKEINGKARVAFYRALGPVDASNRAIMAEYWTVLAVDEFDGRKQASIKGLVDLEFMAAELEKSNANVLINEWLDQQAEARQKAEKEAMHSLKK